MNGHEICREAVRRFGTTHQIDKAIEEQGELISALARWKNGRPVLCNVCEEIVDVEITLEQLRMIVGPDYADYMRDKRREKLDRLAGMLPGGADGTGET